MAQSEVGDTVFYHVNHLGSVELVTDDNASGGMLIESIRYRAYGEVRGVFGAPPGYPEEDPRSYETNLGFGGHYNDSDTGLTYMGARHYDPELGMFLSPDAAAQFPSPFAYSAYDPINVADPDGNFATCVAFIASFIYGIAVAAVIEMVTTYALAAARGEHYSHRPTILRAAGGDPRAIASAVLAGVGYAAGVHGSEGFQAQVQTAQRLEVTAGGVEALASGNVLGVVASAASLATDFAGQGDAAAAEADASTVDDSIGDTDSSVGTEEIADTLAGGTKFTPAPADLLGTAQYYLWRAANMPIGFLKDMEALDYNLDFGYLVSKAVEDAIAAGVFSTAGAARMKDIMRELQEMQEKWLLAQGTDPFTSVAHLDAMMDMHDVAYRAAGFAKVGGFDQLELANVIRKSVGMKQPGAQLRELFQARDIINPIIKTIFLPYPLGKVF